MLSKLFQQLNFNFQVKT